MANKRKGNGMVSTVDEVRITELPNGLRVAHKYIPYTHSVHCGYIFNAGSRDDTPGAEGIAHFIEHMVFKGTARRKTYHVLNYLESVGGEVNAYTTREKTCIYASLASEYVERATNLLTDIAFHATFPEREILKERQVISEEIDLYRDTPDEAIFEDFDQLVFPEHALGAPILGTKDTITHIDQPTILKFVKEHYTSGNVVYALVGNVTEREVNRLIEKYLLPQTLPSGALVREAPAALPQQQVELPIPINQAHEILGGRAFALRKEGYYPFLLLTNMLGGPAMNSRLNLNIRERYGLTYNINTFYSPYLDSGIWGVYYACEAGSLKRIRRLVMKEFQLLRKNKVGSLRLHQMKKQLIGQYTLGYENLLGQMLGMSKDVLDFDYVLPFPQHIAALEAITAEDLLEVSNALFEEDCLSRLTYLPEAE